MWMWHFQHKDKHDCTNCTSFDFWSCLLFGSDSFFAVLILCNPYFTILLSISFVNILLTKPKGRRWLIVRLMSFFTFFGDAGCGNYLIIFVFSQVFWNSIDSLKLSYHAYELQSLICHYYFLSQDSCYGLHEFNKGFRARTAGKQNYALLHRGFRV